MADRMDLLSPRKRRDGKTYFHKLGAAFPNQNNTGWNLVFDSLPLPDDEGQVRLIMMPAQERSQQSAPPASNGYQTRQAPPPARAGGPGDYRAVRSGTAPAPRASLGEELDDEIPF